MDSNHFAQEGAQPLDHALLSGYFVLATIWMATTNDQGISARQHTWTTTYMDSGFRTSKISPVNPALTLSTQRPGVTVTAKGQQLLDD